MDAHLEEEEVNSDASDWSFTSKILLLSNVLVSILVVVVLSFIFMGSGGGEPSSDLDVQPDFQGEFASEKPSNPVKQEEEVVENEIIEEAPEEIVEEKVVDGPVLEDLGDVDLQILEIVEGCLVQRVIGNQCDEIFIRTDIIDYCAQLEDSYDRCYIMAALMNKKIEYCDLIRDEKLLDNCFVALDS